MTISTNYSLASLTATSSDFSSSQISKTDADFAALFSKDTETPQSILADITNGGAGGMLKWQIKQMEHKIADQVLASKNLTKDQVAAMDPQKRAVVEQQIIKEVAQKIKQAINENMKNKNPQQLAYGQIVDIQPTDFKPGSVDFMA